MATEPTVHDLTALLETHMPVWPTAPLPVFEPVAILARDGLAAERVSCLTHTGTHLDAPFHLLEGGRTVDEIPAGRLLGTAALLDVRHDLDGNLIRTAVVEKHWPRRFEPEVVLLETGWSRLRAPTRQYLYEFPGLEPAAAEWLARKPLKGVGIDSLGIDPFSNAQFEAHKALLGKDLWVVEALDHLDGLREETPYRLVVAPLKIAGASGAMARVFATEA